MEAKMVGQPIEEAIRKKARKVASKVAGFQAQVKGPGT
jgi:hypothetical protein